MKVLNLGSLNIDKTYFVNQFVQPKETIKALAYEQHCGGKGLNQTVALLRAGADAYHAGMVGKDGQVLLDILKGFGACTDYIKMTEGTSGHAIIQVDESGQNNIIISGGANDQVDQEYILSVLEHFGQGDMILLQNEITNVNFAIEKAKEKGLVVAFNPSPVNESLYTYSLQKVDYFLVNEVEAGMLAGTDSEKPEDMIDALKQKFPDAGFVITLGEKGAYFVKKDVTVFQKAYTVDTVDTTGAGDTFCGYFIAGLAEGMGWEEILSRSSAAAAIAVSRKGAAEGVPAHEEVEAFLKAR